MRHRFIKIVISKKGKELFYCGDGLWFGRIAKAKAVQGIKEGKYFLYESKNSPAREESIKGDAAV